MHYTICLKLISSSGQVALPPAFARLEQRGVMSAFLTWVTSSLLSALEFCPCGRFFLRWTRSIGLLGFSDDFIVDDKVFIFFFKVGDKAQLLSQGFLLAVFSISNLPQDCKFISTIKVIDLDDFLSSSLTCRLLLSYCLGWGSLDFLLQPRIDVKNSWDITSTLLYPVTWVLSRDALAELLGHGTGQGWKSAGRGGAGQGKNSRGVVGQKSA